MDLRNTGNGRKLIQKIIRNINNGNLPWTKSKQYDQLSKQKNSSPSTKK